MFPFNFIGWLISKLLSMIPLATTNPAKDPDMDNLLKLMVGSCIVGILYLAIAEIIGGL